jgi:hypothetical protein
MITPTIAIIWMIGNVLVWCYASTQNRFGFGYFVLSGFLTPIVVGSLLYLIPHKPAIIKLK